MPAALAPSGVSVSHPKARLDGHALGVYPVEHHKNHLLTEDLVVGDRLSS